MKVALVHDYLKEYGGAERVLEALHEVFPEAPVYTSVYLPNFLGPHKERFANWKIKTSVAQYLPLKSKLISPLRLLAPFLFGRFNFSKYDVVIVSATGAYIPNSIQVKSQKLKDDLNYTLNAKRYLPIHICYCHTPPRYLYGYATARDWKKNIVFRVLGEVANHFLRQIDFKSAQNPDYFIANSYNVAARIKKFYRRESTVIYPPVESASSNLASSAQLKINKKLNVNQLNAKRYFLAGGRLARPKHMDLIVRACRELNLPLKVFGRGFAGYDMESGIRNQESGKKNHNSSFIIHDSIEFVGEVSDEEKLELMINAKAFIMASEEEDFGITPVEAMLCGVPVIAYKSGGLVESVIDGKTGIFFDELTVKSLIKAIEQFNNSTIDPKTCINQAQKFSKERFKKEIKDFVEASFKKA